MSRVRVAPFCNFQSRFDNQFEFEVAIMDLLTTVWALAISLYRPEGPKLVEASNLYRLLSARSCTKFIAKSTKLQDKREEFGMVMVVDGRKVLVKHHVVALSGELCTFHGTCFICLRHLFDFPSEIDYPHVALMVSILSVHMYHEG